MLIKAKICVEKSSDRTEISLHKRGIKKKQEGKKKSKWRTLSASMQLIYSDIPTTSQIPIGDHSLLKLLLEDLPNNWNQSP